MPKIPDISFGSKMETDLTGMFGAISVEAVHIDQYDLPKFPVPFWQTSKLISPKYRFTTPFHLGGELAKDKETLRAIYLG